MRALLLLVIGASLAAAPGPEVDALEVQVRLDRAGFSSGEIDGLMGANTRLTNWTQRGWLRSRGRARG